MFSVSSVSSVDKKVFFAPLRVTSRMKAVRCSPRPSASSADKKVFFAPLRVTSRMKAVRSSPCPSVDN